MLTRLELHEELCDILGSRNVYFQPPASVMMHYPAIVYSLAYVDNRFADNDIYNQNLQYTIIVIDEDPDSIVFERMKKYRRARFNRFYVAEQLNHFVFTIFNN